MCAKSRSILDCPECPYIQFWYFTYITHCVILGSCLMLSLLQPDPSKWNFWRSPVLSGMMKYWGLNQHEKQRPFNLLFLHLYSPKQGQMPLSVRRQLHSSAARNHHISAAANIKGWGEAFLVTGESTPPENYFLQNSDYHFAGDWPSGRTDSEIKCCI